MLIQSEEEVEIILSIVRAALLDSEYFYPDFYEQLKDILLDIEDRKNK